MDGTVRLTISRHNGGYFLEKHIGGQAWITVYEGENFDDCINKADDMYDGWSIVWC